MFVPKKDGGLRLCVDYRGLNRITVKNRTPLPLMTETFDRLRRAKVYTKIDLKDAYHRLRIRAGDEWKTAFRTRYGHFEYQVVPFGLTNALATFQAYINQALVGLVDVTCVIYLDDILIFLEDVGEHTAAVREVLDRLRTHKLYANINKCVFFTDEVEYLGFIISPQGIRMDPTRIDTITDWPLPALFREVQMFLGFANFYRRFGSVEGKKPGPFRMTPEAIEAFAALKRAFTQAPILRHFDLALPIQVEADASGFALSGILSQLYGTRWHPVAFFSRKLTPIECRYETHDKELLAIVRSFDHWDHYLRGAQAPVRVRSDHDNLVYFMTKRRLNGRQSRWAESLARYDFFIEYQPGKRNPADGPSRRPDYRPDGEDQSDQDLPGLYFKLHTALGPVQHIGTLAGGRCSPGGMPTDGYRLGVSRLRQPQTDQLSGFMGDPMALERQPEELTHMQESWAKTKRDVAMLKPVTGAIVCRLPF